MHDTAHSVTVVLAPLTPHQEALFQISGGKLRKRNLLARHCLFAAAADNAKSVTDEHVAKARPEVD